MSRQRFLLLLIAAVLVIGGGLYVSARRERTQDIQGTALLPSLASGMNAVTGVALRKGGATPNVTLHRSGTLWTVAERGDYPADIAKLRKLMTTLRDARIVEEKTADPARYASIGVDDPARPGAGTEISILAPGGNLGLIVGKSTGDGNFVRRSGEKRSFSVEPTIALEAEPRYWIEPRLIDLSSALIDSIAVRLVTAVKPAVEPGDARSARPGAKGSNPAAIAYALRRAQPGADTFVLDPVPADRQPLDGHALAPSPTLLASLDAEDVSPAAAIDMGAASQVVVTLRDGNVLTLTGVVLADKHWLEIQASKDAVLTAKTQGRAFEIASYRYDALFKPLEQLLQPKPLPTPKAAPAAGATRGTSPAS